MLNPQNQSHSNEQNSGNDISSLQSGIPHESPDSTTVTGSGNIEDMEYSSLAMPTESIVSSVDPQAGCDFELIVN